LIDDRDGIEKTFYAIKIGDEWRIVDVTTSKVSCERFARLGFPGALISDCELSFSDAVTVAEIDATFAGFSLEGAELRVIGFVTDTKTDASGTVVTIESGGATTVVTITNTPVTVGDLLVVTLADLADAKQKSNASTGTTGTTGATGTTGVYTVVKTTTIGSQDADLGVPKEKPDNLPQEKKDKPPVVPVVTGERGTTVYKINAPKTAPPQSYFFSEDDVDASFENIQIDGSF
jgi:hypothetical protein